MKKQKTKVLTLILLLFITSCAVTNTSVKPSVIPSKIISSSLPAPISTTPKSSNLEIIKETPSFIPIPSNTPSPLPDKTISPTPYISEPSHFIERETFSGTVYDINGKPVYGVIVSARSIDKSVDWSDRVQTGIDGKYLFRNGPAGARIEIIANKIGWTKRLRTEVLKSNGIAQNIYDFGGPTDTANIYAIQDNPEITYLKINEKSVADSDKNSTISSSLSSRSPDAVSETYLTSIDPNNILIELPFSEPVQRDSVENNFRIISTSKFDNKKESFIINRNTSGVSFSWSNNNDFVSIKISKPLLSNIRGNEAKYLLEFANPFKDKNGIASTPNRAIKFSASKMNDFCVFSVKNQDQTPIITGIDSFNDSINNKNVITINFNIPMEVIENANYQGILENPENPTDLKSRLYSYNTNNLNDNNATVLGYTNNLGIFKAVYVIGLIKAKDIKTAIDNKSGEYLKLKPLGGDFINTPSQYNNSNPPIKSAKIYENNITLELNSNAFEKDDILILSAGNNIDTGYNDTQNSIFVKSLTPKLNLPDNSSFTEFTEPSGKILDTHNINVDGIISTSNSQKYVVVR